MRFVNNGPNRQIRIGTSENCRWVGLNKGQVIDLPVDMGRKLGLDEITEGKIGGTKVETKQFENKEYVSFWNDLLKINGVGVKIATDIIKVFKSEKEIIKAIKSKEHLPFRDDVVEKLKKKYGK